MRDLSSRSRLGAIALILGLVAAACGGQSTAPAAQATAAQATAVPAAPATAAPTVAATPAPTLSRIAYSQAAAESTHFGFHKALMDVISRKVVAATPIGNGVCGPSANMMASGEAHLGLICSPVAYDAVNGVGDYQGKAIALRALLWYSISEQLIVVTEDSGVTKLEDLAGKKFNPGVRASSTEAMTLKAFKALGIEPNLQRGTLADSVTAIKDRQSIGYVKGGVGFGIDATTKEIAATQKIRVLSFTPEQVKKVQAASPDLVFMTIPAGGLFAGSPEVTTYTQLVGVATTKDFPEDLAYRVLKAAYESNEDLVRGYPAIKGVDLAKLTIESSVIPLHAGAVRYYKEAGQKIPDKLLPPGGK